jgi:hypothetical protein
VVGSGNSSGLVAGNAAGMCADSCVWGARRRFIQSKKRRMRWTLGATRRRREGGPDKAIATGRWMSLPTQASPSSPVETSSNDISFL